MRLNNIYNEGRNVYLFSRDDNGNLKIVNDDTFFPYFYELHPEGQLKTIYGESVKKVFALNPSEVSKIRTNSSYEADILFSKRYIIDKVDKIDKGLVKYAFIDIEVLAPELPDVQRAEYPISCISVYNSLYKNIQTFYLEDYPTEYKLIEDFIKYMQKEQFDLWLSWNVNFDYKYLYYRIENIKEELSIINDRRDTFAHLISPIRKVRYGDGEIFYPAGTSIVDYLTWYQKITLNRKKSYALDDVAQDELKESSFIKIDFGQLGMKIKEKNINDINRMIKLEEKKKLIPYYDQIRRLSKVYWEDMNFNSRIVDSLLLQEAKNQNIVLPMKPAEDRGTLLEKESFEGAYREAFETGAFFGLSKYDLSSAYPMAIIEFCLDPANIKKTKEENCIEIEGSFFLQNPKTLLPTVVKKVIDLKNEIGTKKKATSVDSPEYEDIKMDYDVIKTVVNSCYGVFGSRFFRLYNKKVASATTFIVRSLLHYVQEKMEEAGYKVIYVDTDSIFLSTSENKVELLNQLIQQWVKEKFGKDKVGITFEHEGSFNEILILSKCRYKGNLLKPNGEIEPETKGIESKRKDSTEYMKKFQTTLINKIFVKEEKERIFDWILKEIGEFKKQPLQTIAFPCRLGRKIEDYKNKPIFVRALQYSTEIKKKVGENFYWLYVNPVDYEEDTIQDFYVAGKKITPKYFKELYKEYFKEELGKEFIKKETWEKLITKLQEVGKLEIKKRTVKGKAKNVKAFDEDQPSYIKPEEIDWNTMITRNILMKLATIFTAMKWDIKEILSKSGLALKGVKIEEEEEESEQ
jgi:DNA polymerase elongation subunit (family B)